MWKHKKYKNTFASIKNKINKNFVLYGETSRGKLKFIEYKSWQDAKAKGWEKVG